MPGTYSDGKVYLVKGSTLNRIEKRIDDLWGGENLQRGPGIRKRSGGSGGVALAATSTASPPSFPSVAIAWPFKVYNASTAAGGMVRVNGGDGFVALINGFKLQVEGQDNDDAEGMPPVYPTLSGISGNGWIYANVAVDTPGDATTVSSFDLLFATDLPDQDTSTPAGFFIIPMATITGYTAGVGGAAPSFSVNNVTNYGYTTLAYCGNALGVW